MIVKTVTLVNDGVWYYRDVVLDSKFDFNMLVKTKDMSLIRHVMDYSSGVSSLVLENDKYVVRS